MPVKWVDKFVKCPFYRKTDQNRIVCEGLAEGNTINLVFEDPSQKARHMRSVCYDLLGCRDCPIYTMLDAKYEGGDNGVD
jgi:hypothetical protein